ncbi:MULTISPECIES: S1C family serine protease [unclassified Rubrivivax]|uniref:S1C family serine protease n=1 Tax=unclassified Rubrivivax TaxID=2649762 RepID=UPI0013E98D3E|nr:MULTISPECIES: serine protease [unclassified Rubrivivax]MCC9596301.1 serine protease [Rubrivivax sp. JA1055]MCC9647358.1 serine protease [Rubrivivax sp. JA1029]
MRAPFPTLIPAPTSPIDARRGAGHGTGPRRRAWLAASLLSLTLPAWAGLPDVIAAAKPGVVAVGTFNPLDNPRFSFRGSGFAVLDGSYVITNQHVLPPANEVEQLSRLSVLVARNGKVSEARSARLAGSDRSHDLVLLKIEGPSLPPLPLADADAAREGMSIALMGFPIAGALGYSPVTHRGIVSAVTSIALPAANSRQLDPRALQKLREGSFDIFQLDATAYPGNSGGPVLDAETGEVVAVVNMVLVRGTRENAIQYPSGISYAIPVRHVHELLQQAAPPEPTATALPR